MRRFSFLAALALLTFASPAAAQEPERTVLPPDAMVADVPLGGLTRGDAREELEAELAQRYAQPIDVRIRRRHPRVTTEELGQRIRYGQMLTTAYDLAREGRPVNVSLRRTFSSRRLTLAIRELGRPWFKAPRNARAIFRIRRVKITRARYGRALDERDLRAKLVDELWRPTLRRTVRGHVSRVRPAVGAKTLRRSYRTYISVDRSSRIVRLFKRLRVVRRYRVAVGAAGYATPAGMHRVLSKQVNPTWYVPNRSWAGSLAGQRIPPGDPRNPLKARFIAIGGGVGFHGTGDLASIGRAASHGCIRMTVPDVISLYNRTPVGTSVLIR
jgi:hypothetical protein